MSDGRISEYIKADWTRVPILKDDPKDLSEDQRLIRIIEVALNCPNVNQREILKEKCWNAALNLPKGSQILWACQACLQIPGKESDKDGTFIMRFEDKEYEVPTYLKKALAKDSEYFEKLFFGKFREGITGTVELTETTSKEFLKFFKYWDGEKGCANLQKALDLIVLYGKFLMHFDSDRSTPESFLKRHLLLASKIDTEVIDQIAEIAKELVNHEISTEIKALLVDYLKTIFLTTNIQKNREVSGEALKTIGEDLQKILSDEKKRTESLLDTFASFTIPREGKNLIQGMLEGMGLSNIEEIQTHGHTVEITLHAPMTTKHIQQGRQDFVLSYSKKVSFQWDGRSYKITGATAILEPVQHFKDQRIHLITHLSISSNRGDCRLFLRHRSWYGAINLSYNTFLKTFSNPHDAIDFASKFDVVKNIKGARLGNLL